MRLVTILVRFCPVKIPHFNSIFLVRMPFLTDIAVYRVWSKKTRTHFLHDFVNTNQTIINLMKSENC